jgi:hypothetical protein
MGESDVIDDVKRIINNLIWMYGDGEMTLIEAEKMATTIYYMIKDRPERNK